MTQPIQLSVDELIGGSKAQFAIKLFGASLAVLKAKAKGKEIAAEVKRLLADRFEIVHSTLELEAVGTACRGC